MSTAAPPVLPERLYTAILRCRDCGAELNRAEHVPEHDRTVSARPWFGVGPRADAAVVGLPVTNVTGVHPAIGL